MKAFYYHAPTGQQHDSPGQTNASSASVCAALGKGRRRPMAELSGDFYAAVCRGRNDPGPISASTKRRVHADMVPRPIDLSSNGPRVAAMLVALALPCPGLTNDALSGHGDRTCVIQRVNIRPNCGSTTRGRTEYTSPTRERGTQRGRKSQDQLRIAAESRKQ